MDKRLRARAEHEEMRGQDLQIHDADRIETGVKCLEFLPLYSNQDLSKAVMKRFVINLRDREKLSPCL